MELERPVQTGWQGGVLTETDWREPVRERLRLLDWKDIQADARRLSSQALTWTCSLW